MKKKSKVLCYVGLDKTSNTVVISTYKASIADHVGINVKTMTRHMEHSSYYNTDEYSIWSDVPLKKRRTGYSIRSKY